MIQSEQVTDFVLGAPEQAGVTIRELIAALNRHCFPSLLEAERFGSITAFNAPGLRIPARYFSLVAFAAPGANGVFYVHVGAILATNARPKDRMHLTSPYLDFGFSRVETEADANILATKAQQFLTAARAN